MNLKIRHRAARLASPTISPQDLLAQPVTKKEGWRLRILRQQSQASWAKSFPSIAEHPTSRGSTPNGKRAFENGVSDGTVGNSEVNPTRCDYNTQARLHLEWQRYGV